VVEFFWYGCPHCYSLESDVNAWLKNLPKDVVFKRVHAAPNESWAGVGEDLLHAGIRWASVDQYHAKVFDAFHKDNQNLANPRIRDGVAEEERHRRRQVPRRREVRSPSPPSCSAPSR
jgi:thiol:disulfide interchange protein DsbA